MITLKASTYKPEDIKYLRTILGEIVYQIQVDSTDAQCEKIPCSLCKHKIVCDDMYSLLDYCIREEINGFPHCRKKRGK